MRNLLKMILGVLVITSFTYIDPIDIILAAFKKYEEIWPQEKVYLQLNQPRFFTGDRIWFKAYVVAGPDQIPSTVSSTLYVELISPKKNLLSRIKIHCPQGAGSGSFLLPDTLQTGNYVIRAFTQWMKNSDEAYFFHRTVKIFNELSDSQPNGTAADKIDLQFFPESGQWVAGFKSKMAFKAVGSDGLGRKVDGKIIDHTGKAITNFQSNFLGMGYCELIPQKGESYRAMLNEPALELNLPEVLESGVTLTVSERADQDAIVVRIQNSGPEKDFYLLAQCRGVVNHMSHVNMPGPIAFVRIPKQDLLTGIVQLTLVSLAGLPVAERLIFIDHHEMLNIQVKPDKEISGPREKVVLQIDVRDDTGKPVAADLSIAVTDDRQIIQDSKQESIFSYLYMASDLKGNIEHSGYYFNPDNADRKEALDALMLTQGWRRFSFEKMASGLWPKFEFMPEQGITLTGKMTEKASKKPSAGGTVKYLNTYPFPDIRIAKTDENGRFEFTELLFFDSSKVVLHGTNKHGNSTVRYTLEEPSFSQPRDNSFFIPDVHRNGDENFVSKAMDRKKINKAYDYDTTSVVLSAIEVRGKKIEKNDNLNSSLKRIYGAPSASIQVANNTGMEWQQHPLQLLQGRVAGVLVTGSDNNWNIQIRGITSVLSGTTPMILVNNMPWDINALSVINVRDIEAIDVYKGADTAIFGVRGTNGVIVIYLKSGVNAVPVSDDTFVFRGGYQAFRKFYSPKYDVMIPENIKPDYRATLFWEPFVKTDSTGKAVVTFYNHDLPTTVTGILEGMSPTGLVGSHTFQYTIKK